MRYPGYLWKPQILEPVCKFVHRPVCMLFYVSKFQHSSSNGLEMAVGGTGGSEVFLNVKIKQNIDLNSINGYLLEV
jgi:hypothetical protein